MRPNALEPRQLPLQTRLDRLKHGGFNRMGWRREPMPKEAALERLKAKGLLYFAEAHYVARFARHAQ